MQVFLLTMICMISAACVCSISYIAVNKRLQNSQVHHSETENNDIIASENPDSDKKSESGNSEDEKSRKKLSFSEMLKSGFSISPVSRWSTFTISVLLVGIVCFCAQTFRWGGTGIDTLGFIKIAITAQIMMSAAVIDLFTKKIPNYLPLLFIVIGTVILIIEFIFMRQSFPLLLGGSLIGLVGGFLVLLLMSLITKGGIGMGDVKLISTMGYLNGIVASFYSFFFATVLCLIITLVLLISKLKQMKDELPFGPFLFLGYILTIILGKF